MNFFGHMSSNSCISRQSKASGELQRINQNLVKTKLCQLMLVSTHDDFKNFICKHLSLLPRLSFYLTHIRDISDKNQRD